MTGNSWGGGGILIMKTPHNLLPVGLALTLFFRKCIIDLLLQNVCIVLSLYKIEPIGSEQEAHQKASLDQIFSADRQSLLAEVRDLRAHANVSGLRHQEEKERLTEQLNCVEDQTSKRERQLKRQGKQMLKRERQLKPQGKQIRNASDSSNIRVSRSDFEMRATAQMSG